jgi:hypothetical protein
VRISFPDGRTQRMFCVYSQLEASLGTKLAERVATRMAVLAAAEHLGQVPRRPPVGLRLIDGARGLFAVDLVPPRRLRFIVVRRDTRLQQRDGADLTLVDEIEVLDVE